MSLVSNIEKVCKERGLTFKALERAAGVGNGTIRRWEVQSPRLDGLLKVADYLHMTIDELLLESSETTTSSSHSPSCDGVTLSPMECDLIAMFRLLPRNSQEEVFDLVYFKYSRISNGGKGSIFWTYFDDKNKTEPGTAGGGKAQDITA